MTEVVYFLLRQAESPTSKPSIKIGTTNDFRRRLAQLEAQYGHLTLLGLMDGGRELEQQLHNQFSGWRLRDTEFFMSNPFLYLFIEERTHMNVPPERIGITIDLPHHLRVALGLLKLRMGKRNMAAVVEILLQAYDQGALQSGIRMAKEKGLYEPIENGDGNGNDA